MPVLTGKTKLAADRPLFFRRRKISVRQGVNYISQSAVRQGEWKYLRTYKPVGSDKYRSALFNLSDDIAEENDLSASNPEKLKAMNDLLEEWEAEISRTAIPFAPASPKKTSSPNSRAASDLSQ